jgi:hypothetical protein
VVVLTRCARPRLLSRQTTTGLYHPNTLGQAFRGQFGIPVTFCKRCDVLG